MRKVKQREEGDTVKSEDKEKGESDEKGNKILVFKFTFCEQ